MDRAAVRERLADIEDPDLGGSLLERGLIDVVEGEGGIVVEVALGAVGSPTEADLLHRIEAAVDDLDAVAVERVPPSGSADADVVLGGVSNVVAVASGKGGVGKTSVAVNLAAGLADRGADVGLFDADVYGPNAPMMVGGDAQPSATPEETLKPPVVHGMKVISMDYLVGEEDPIIWRGPMVHKVITQLWEDVEWGALDYLVVDLPPGTGDTQLTLLQTVPLTGAVVVTTPQDVALHDARKGLEMFGRHETAVLGIVENMAGFRCPDCGARHDIFDAGGGRRLADDQQLPFLGSIPIDPAIRTGEGPVVLDEDADAGAPFREIVANVADAVGVVSRRGHGA